MDSENEPEREPLRFDLDINDVPPDMVAVMQQVKQLCEKMLFHWKTFPIILPVSITEGRAGSEVPVSFKDLFISPTFDELEEVALDKDGKSKLLTAKQLKSVQEMGEFDVESIHFPGQLHRWRLTQLLQKGTLRSRETLLDDAALALRLLIITARNRFVSPFFSLSQSLNGIGKAFWQIFDILLGLASTTPGNLTVKLQEEHTRFLAAELKNTPQCPQQWTLLCDYIRSRYKQNEVTKQTTVEFKPPPVPYRFQTPNGLEVDLRLFNKDLMDKCTAIIHRILERESRGWYIKFKDKIIAEVKGQNMSHSEITERVNTAIMEEYVRRVFEAVRSDEDLETLQPNIGDLLVQQATCVIGMHQAVENLKGKLQRHKQELGTHLVKTYPLRSRIEAWLNEKYLDFQKEFIEQHQWSAHEETMEICRREQLKQSYYFVHRDLIFMRDQEPVLRKELSKVRQVNRTFTFQTRIWLPSNWTVTRILYGQTKVVPTLIVTNPAAYTGIVVDPDRPTYEVSKYTRRKTSTRYPFWRWLNYFHRSWAWTWNAMFWLGLVVPWCSPVSLRVLFFPFAFMPDLKLDQVNGNLCPRTSSLTHTLLSRLRLLWHHVHESRAAFESDPDKGFLGKSFSRHINRVWNYVLKGACGSVALVLGLTPLCLTVSSLSLVAAVTAPLWVPIVTFVVHLSAVLIYDFDHPSRDNHIMYLFEAIFYRFLLQGCLQPVAAVAVATICCPLASFFIITAGVMRRGIRAAWDTFTFHAVIKSRGLVPAHDSFIARRVTGPGLASNYFYQVHPSQALAAVESRMEQEELKAWRDSVLKVIEQPKKEFQQFVSQCFHPFSAVLCEQGVYRDLVQETKHLCEWLQTKITERQKHLHTGLNPDIRARVKVSGRELKVIILQTANMLQEFYPDRVIRRQTQSEEMFWESRHLEVDDWQGLASQLLAEAFSSAFLTPLEATDTCFRLEVQHLNLSRYVDMLKSAEFRDDLDVVSTIHTPKGDIDVDAPFLEMCIFNPVHEKVAATGLFTLRSRQVWKKPWKKTSAGVVDLQKLVIPLPIAHPATISVLIYNRENDQTPIDLGDDTCQRILISSELQPYTEIQCADADTTNGDASTPDHMTSSDGEVILSNLAEPEAAGSFEDDTCVALPVEETPNDECYVGSEVRRASNRDNGAGMRVIYLESEADTSCVLEMADV